MQAGHQGATGGSADGAARVAIGEADALGSETVEVRRLDDFLAIATEVAVTEIVGEDEEDVGFPFRLRLG
jgi:hypothetical protein